MPSIHTPSKDEMVFMCNRYGAENQPGRRQ